MDTTTDPPGATSSWGNAEWPLHGNEVVTREMLKSLRPRLDGPALIRLAVHAASIVLTGVLLWTARETVWMILLMPVFGTLIALLFGPLHECSHGTAFRTRWMNEMTGHMCGFLGNRPFLYFRYRHTAHHTFTQHPHLDPDRVPLSRSLLMYVLEMFGYKFWKMVVDYHWRGCQGKFDASDLSCIAPLQIPAVVREFRVVMAGYVLMFAAAYMLDPWAPLVLIIGPRITGEILLRFLRMSEHTGTEDSPDLLRNTRTTKVSGILHYFYWEMPYHAEHHLAPSVPFHALKRLHAAVGDKVAHTGAGLFEVHMGLIRSIRKNTLAAGQTDKL